MNQPMPRGSIEMDQPGFYTKIRGWIFTVLPSSILKGAVVYLLWITLHYASSHLYVKVCTHPSVYGFLLSPIIVDTPYCSAIRWTIYHGAAQIRLMWAFLGGYAANGLEKIWG
jgi:hypothetical protein